MYIRGEGRRTGGGGQRVRTGGWEVVATLVWMQSNRLLLLSSRAKPRL